MENCKSCSNPLPLTGYFCGGCLTQFKCKSCDAPLEVDYAGCTNCGTPKINTAKNSVPNNFNTFRLHETSTDRTIEATFSNEVGKDLAGILRDSYASKLAAKQLGTAYSGANPLPPETTEEADAEVINEKPVQKTVIIPNNYPTLLAAAMRNLPATETEWVIVYSFFASNFGNDTFTRKDILEKYKESKRFNKETTTKTLSVYIKLAVNGQYINPLQDEFAMFEKGIEKAKEILSRTTSSSAKPTKNRSKNEQKTEDGNLEKTAKNKRATAKNTNTPKRLSNLDLAPTGKRSLEDFYNEWPEKKNNENNLLFTYYLQEILKIDTITADHIYTCYDALNLIIPTAFAQSLANTIARTGWIQTNNGNLSVTTKGSNYLKTWKKKAV
ncbi:zinc ribbon domain-containing protein [Rurimicrobium arvi]|uniref:Zinc ribbon domain-containing protein n=1 Tax=Rurimicrobium arvi TaxID=2049916 RepID=A0ABP8MXQ0_9BACT